MKLSPKAGFEWGRVAWGRPDSVRSAVCSYCFAAIGVDDVPLILSAESGAVAQFCDHCQATWWGLRSYPDEPDEDDAPPAGEG